MSRYIDADILAELVEEEFDGIVVYDVPPDEAVSDICDIIDSCPTVDVAPVVHGKWVTKSKRIVDKETGETKQHYIWSECSKCRKHNQSKSNYCPNCGAKMESEDKGE